MSVQTIYQRLRAAGISRPGALALMGNWQCESGNESCRLQGDFSADRAASRQYADRVDNGRLSEDQFAWDGEHGLGWGLAQWSLGSRRRKLLRFCRQRSISIANEEVQVDFAVWELREEPEYRVLGAALRADGDLYALVDRVCREYERPAVNNVGDRHEAALAIAEQVSDGAAPAAPSAGEAPGAGGQDTNVPASASGGDYWPPRGYIGGQADPGLCLGMIGPDVQLLQALLICHGYDPGGCSGIFDLKTRNMVVGFQAAYRLDQDGIVGPQTWRALLRVQN